MKKYYRIAVIILVITWTLGHQNIQCEENHYWVRPNISTDCPRDVVSDYCVLLSDIAKNSSIFLTNNVAIHFLAGVHTITTNSWINCIRHHPSEISYDPEPAPSYQPAENISIMGHHSLDGEPAIIHCQTSRVGFAFYYVKKLSLSGLTIRHCGFNVGKTKTPSTMNVNPNTHATVYMVYCWDLNIKEVLIEESVGIGLLAVELGGNVTIESCVFQYNTKQEMGRKVIGGNAYLIGSLFNSSLRINILNSLFANGYTSSSELLFTSCYIAYICSIKASTGLSIHLYINNLYGSNEVFIHNVTFHNNSAPMVGNMFILIVSDGYEDRLTLNSITFIVNNCTFSKGNATKFSGGGIQLSIMDNRLRIGPNSNINAAITNSKFAGNTARTEGGAIAIKSYVSIITTIVHIRNNTFIDNEATIGAGIDIKSTYAQVHLTYPELVISIIRRHSIVIDRNLFQSNRASNSGGAVVTTVYTETDPYEANDVTFDVDYHLNECIFIGNSANTGSAFQLVRKKFRGEKMLYTINFVKKISNCTFTQNIDSGVTGSGKGSVIYLENIDNLAITNTSIHDNLCTGILTNMSSIIIGQNIQITSNTAMQGAGILLICYTLAQIAPTVIVSHLVLTNSSSLHIENNHALTFGGGIVVQTGCSVPELCFFQLTPDLSEGTKQLVHMSGNTAGIAGTSIYGGDLENCYFESPRTPLPFNSEIFWSVFNISTANTQPSVVASQAYKACICTLNFTTSRSCEFDYSVRVYPGQPFHVPMVGVGQYNYSSPSVIRATIVDGYRAVIGDQQVTQDVSLFCKNFTYTLQTKESQVTIRLVIEVPFGLDSTLPKLQAATVHATILDCPLGFKLNENSSECNCIKYLLGNGITCNIMDQTVHKTAFMWIGNYTGVIVVHENCPFDYCNQTVTDISLYTQDEQCNFNRAGILCGACQPGHSLVLGTSLCTECSNIYLLLLIPIILAGFVLVALLLKCNLTVSTGTINGLVFYANILQVNNKFFFPNTNTYTTSYILSVIIAWINLDLGIEVCFARDLDTYSRTWLQFLFPIYIWLLVGLLILVCRYSVTVTRLAGHHTVSVLATLFLLSYAKLLRTTLDILSPTTITDPQGKQHLVWLLDGNYEFLQGPHLALFFAALVTLVAHLLPFTLLVLLGPTIQAYSNKKLLRWVTKFKPLLDAYQGPYKTKYRYWTGVMLLVRILLFIVFAGNALGDPNINLLTIILTVLVLLIVWVTVGRVYRQSPLNALELFYLLNLGVTTGVTSYLRSTSDNNTQPQAIVTGIMVGSTVIVFTGTLVYHGYSEMTQSRLGRRAKEKITAFRLRPLSEQGETTQEVEESVRIQANSPTRTVVSLNEPLLDDE